jgi:hypothetical protein
MHFFRPLPLGEGWGEGLRSTVHFLYLLSDAARPYPWPLPMGEGKTTDLDLCHKGA